MRRWVEYKDGRVVTIDRNRLLKKAMAFQKACDEYKNEPGVSGVAYHYKAYLDSALKNEIQNPILDRLPYTGEMRDRELPAVFHSVLNRFCDALEGRPAIYEILDADILLHHRDKFIKEENGTTYILECFEDD